MLRKLVFWILFVGTTLYSLLSVFHILMRGTSWVYQIRNPFVSLEWAFEFAWSVLPIFLALVAIPFIVRRVVIFIHSRTLSPPRLGYVASIFFGVFLVLLLIVYGTKMIPLLRPLAFNAGLFKLFLTQPFILAYLACECSAWFSRKPNPANQPIDAVDI